MTKTTPGFLSLLVLAGCAHLPALAPIPDQDARAAVTVCRSAFPAQPWRATHAIFATLPFGQHSQLLGVTAADGTGLSAVLLSPEGLALFDATSPAGASAGRLVVRRAVPPFDRPDFSVALMADVGHAFLAPLGEPVAVGRYASGATACRWSPPGGETTDVELDAEGPRFVRTFRNLHITREIALAGSPDRGFSPALRLMVPGAGGYTLDLRLVDRE